MVNKGGDGDRKIRWQGRQGNQVVMKVMKPYIVRVKLSAKDDSEIRQ